LRFSCRPISVNWRWIEPNENSDAHTFIIDVPAHLGLRQSA